MKKKNILWIFLAVLFLAALLILGNRLTEKMQEETPPVILPPGQSETQTPESTEPPSASGEEPSENVATESQPSESERETASTTEPSTSGKESAPKPTAPPTTPPSEEGEDLQVRIDALVAEVYGLKDYYLAQLAYLENRILADYDALPEEEKTPERRRSMALKCIDEAYALEDECDSRMDEICNELSYLLLKTDGRMNLVNDIRYTYAKEKEQAKTQFMEKYADYFG